MKQSRCGIRTVFTGLVVMLVLSIAGCTKTGVSTTSTVTLTFANNGKPVGDPTAVTTIGQRNVNALACFADGGPQPTFIPIGSGWEGYGSSSGAGKCFFKPVPVNTTQQVEYFSAECGLRAPGQPFDVITAVHADAQGNTPPFNVCTINSNTLAVGMDSHFATTQALPTSVTFNSSGLSSSFAFPQLLVYDVFGNLVGQATASSVATDGSSATFPFPTTPSGFALNAGFYMFAVKNFTDASGDFKVVEASYFSLGTGVTSNGVFGVDAVDVVSTTTVCVPGERVRCQSQSTSTATFAAPVVTQYYANSVTFQGQTILVGTQPVAVKAYGSAIVISTPDSETTVRQTIPARAIVANSGSNNVSIVDLAHSTLVATIAVGVQPMGLALNSGATKAYVANYGSGTVSEVDLASLAVTRTTTVGPAAQSVTTDPGGNSIWVGGSGYLKQVDLTSLAVTVTQTVNGAVTSLATSAGQNELAYTVVGGCCSSSSSYAASELQLSNLAAPVQHATGSATAYAAFTMNATLPSASAGPGATAVSAQWGNGMSASATPTGFVIYDLVNHTEIMRGTTPTPVRGIASDPNNTVVYMTIPDSNQYLIITLPPQG